MSEKGAKYGGRRMKGFESASGLLRHHIREAGESRGFAVAKVLTHWDEIAGPQLAKLARPVKVSYAAKGGFGATLVLLTSSAYGPIVEMQKETLRQRVNACYGYNAVSRVVITQTAATGFAEARASFAPRLDDPGFAAKPAADPQKMAAVAEVAEEVSDPTLRAALEALGRSILSRS